MVNKHYETFSKPAVNIRENFSNFALELAVPGMGKEDFSIELEKDVLTINAKKSSTQETELEQGEKYTRVEFNYGEFSRSFRLPESVEQKEIQANYENGILSITLPKKEAEKDIKRMVEIS
jgi:HSP20 family protein